MRFGPPRTRTGRIGIKAGGTGEQCLSASSVGGGLGSGLESDEAIPAAYSKREEERLNRLARERT
jgi:hypothetical protein